MSEYVKVVVDAMGGDNAPVEIIKGAVGAINANETVKVLLTGKQEVIEEELKQYEYNKDQVEIIDAREVIEMAGIKWKILDKTVDGYFAITESFFNDSIEFDGKSNNWANSDLRKYLNTEFVEKIEEELGNDSLVEFKRDLLSLDGQTEYGTCMDKVSILSVDEYRKYRKYLPNMDKWWWLISPWSTTCNGYEKQVTVVSPSGFISSRNYYYSDGVLPVCIFSYSIFESEE